MTFVRPSNPGEYYPRIFRGAETVFTLADEETRTQTAVGLRYLVDQLRDIFTAVEPTGANALAYGPWMRQLLILACTEVEAAWAGILRGNGYTKDRPTTKDYVRLAEPLLLAEYVVGLRDYPGYAWVKPFEGWNEQQATESLAWYAAYNRTKHNREGHLRDASLERVIVAVAGALAMACAQFGTELFVHGGRFGQTMFLVNGPTFRVPVDGYIPPGTGGNWQAMPYPF